MDELKISVSGIRGIVGKSLLPTNIVEFCSSFGTYIGKGEIAVAMDTRSSGNMIKNLVCGALASVGCDADFLGIMPSPTLLATVRYGNYNGGVIITASHNPKEWNALKFVNQEGKYLHEEDSKKVFAVYKNKNFSYKMYDGLGKYTEKSNEEFIDAHIEKVLSAVDVELIKSKRFNVVADLINATACTFADKLFDKLGCELIKINDTPDGNFKRGPEPTPDNLLELCDVVKNNSFDIGFAFDPDADRLALVDENGVAPGEEYTLILCVDSFLRENKSDIAVNLSTSRMIEDVAKKHNSKVFRTKIGEINVTESIIANNCLIGGEGNGGVILKDINYGRDSIVGIALILDYLAKTSQTLSEAIKQIPKYYFIKEKVSIDDKDLKGILSKVLIKYQEEEINDIDGIRVDKQELWVHIRPSNTEPIIRIFCEAKTEELARNTIDEILEIVNNS